MNDGIIISKLQKNDRNKLLLKEALSLSNDLAAMDKKIEADVRRINGDFAVTLERFFNEYPGEEVVVDQWEGTAIEKSIGFVLSRLARVLKIPIKEFLGLGVVVDVFTSNRVPLRAAYLDTRPELAGC